MKSFGDLLREFRQRSRMTQQDMADRLGVSSPYIAQMESGFKPPPPQLLVEKMCSLMKLNYEERRKLSDSAGKQRKMQTLVKATRKAGFLLAGNKVCVPQKSVNFGVQRELEDLFENVPNTEPFEISLKGKGAKSRGKYASDVIRSLDDLKSWFLFQLDEKPSNGLVFLGLLYEILLLTPDDRLITRTPTTQREELIQHLPEILPFFENLKQIMQEIDRLVSNDTLPDVIAPHDSWRNEDERAKPPQVETVPVQQKDSPGIRHISIVGLVEQGTDIISDNLSAELLGLPHSWFEPDQDYEACVVRSDAYVSVGIWPGCKVIYELGGSLQNEDLVVVQLEKGRCIRKYFDLGELMMLQGGPLARPVQVSKTDQYVQVYGVVRELLSRFKDMR